jgi:WhiB family redox-sensing transcriptional regulator
VTTSTLRELEWQDRAACRGMPLDAFFPPPGVHAAAAQRACSRCPVAGPCRDYGATQEHGVWGGLAASAMRRERAATVKPAVPEGLQAPAQQPYRSQGTANTTTTPPQEAPAMTAKTTATKTATTPAPEPTTAPDTAQSKQADVDGRAKSTAAKDGTHDCAVCQQNLPLVKFPTARTAEGVYERDTTECRSCRDARRAAKKAAKATAA